MSSNKEVEREPKVPVLPSAQHEFSIEDMAKPEGSAILVVPGCLWKCRLLCCATEKS